MKLEDLMTIVEKVGKAILARRGEASEGHWEGPQFKSKIDGYAHQLLEIYLTKLDASVPIISEENPQSLRAVRPRKYWLIDPIDGTASFAHGYDGYVTQAALMENGCPVAAAIFAPSLGEMYAAEKGGGAYHNGSSLHCSTLKPFGTLIDNEPVPSGIAKEVYDHFSCADYIECGSISLKICKVADGTADLFVKDVVVKDWDIAAPQLVLQEAGGVLTDLNGAPFHYNHQYSNQGLIASQSAENVNKVAGWHKEKRRGKGS